MGETQADLAEHQSPAFLYVVLYNLCLDLLKKKKRARYVLERYLEEVGIESDDGGTWKQSSGAEDVRLPNAHFPEDKLSESWQGAIFHAALDELRAELDDRDRLILDYLVHEEVTSLELERILGISRFAVMRRKKTLYDALAKKCHALVERSRG